MGHSTCHLSPEYLQYNGIKSKKGVKAAKYILKKHQSNTDGWLPVRAYCYILTKGFDSSNEQRFFQICTCLPETKTYLKAEIQPNMIMILWHAFKNQKSDRERCTIDQHKICWISKLIKFAMSKDMGPGD